MSLSNTLRDVKGLQGTVEYHDCVSTLCVLLAPMAPHIASELWQTLGEAARELNLPVLEVSIVFQERIGGGGGGGQPSCCFFFVFFF